MIWYRDPRWPNDQRLDDPLFADRCELELGEVAHRLPRLVRVRIDLLDGHHAADRSAARHAQRVDVMRVVAHLQALSVIRV
jgi:hypothetical protein